MNVHRFRTRAQKEAFRRSPKAPKWGPLAAPVDPLDNTILARAMSLTGRRDLTAAEARAVVEEYDLTHQPLSFMERMFKKVQSWRSSR